MISLSRHEILENKPWVGRSHPAHGRKLIVNEACRRYLDTLSGRGFDSLQLHLLIKPRNDSCGVFYYAKNRACLCRQAGDSLSEWSNKKTLRSRLASEVWFPAQVRRDHRRYSLQPAWPAGRLRFLKYRQSIHYVIYFIPSNWTKLFQFVLFPMVFWEIRGSPILVLETTSHYFNLHPYFA